MVHIIGLLSVVQYSVGSFADSGVRLTQTIQTFLTQNRSMNTCLSSTCLVVRLSTGLPRCVRSPRPLSPRIAHALLSSDMESMTGMLENLMFLSPTRNLLYITDTIGLIPSRNFEHLSCFFPGLLALGAETLPESLMSAEQKELHMWAAEGLAHTCWVTYMDQPSGLGPEIVTFEGWGHRNGPTSAGQPNDNWKQERWMRHVEQWQMGGKQGGKPPGVRDAGMPVQSGEGKRLDYTILRNSYFLRPEVCICLTSLT